MARSTNIAFLAAILVAALLQRSAAQTTHVVGDALGWVIPSNGAATYSTWSANQTFAVGDILVFNFANGAHDVAKVTKADYDACATSNPISLANTSPARFPLNATGEHYFICNFTGHCSLGQKLMVNISAAASSPAPQPPSSSPVPAPQPTTRTPVSAPAPTPGRPAPAPGGPAPVSAPSPTPSRSAVTYTVGDSLGWAVPSAGAAAYQTWAANKSFRVGDILVFNYATGAHTVAEVTKQSYGSCNSTSPISLNSTPPTRVTLTTTGEHFFICTIPGHCSVGQKLAINVTGTSTTTPPSSPASPPGSTATPPGSSATPPGSSTTPPSLPTPSAPSPTGVSAPPPPGSSATSLGVTGLSATILSIFVTLLF